jgi:hypothetical protein
VEVAVEEFFASKDKEWFHQAFKELAEKWVKTIEHEGLYFWILNYFYFECFNQLKFSFRIWHYLWDTLSILFTYTY